MNQLTQAQIVRLVRAAHIWAAFQEGESVEDQQTDARLKAQAIEARERLLTIIEDLPSLWPTMNASTWIKVTDQLPPERTLVLAYWAPGPMRFPAIVEVAQLISEFWSCADGDRDFNEPTHWTHLPDLPDQPTAI